MRLAQDVAVVLYWNTPIHNFDLESRCIDLWFSWIYKGS